MTASAPDPALADPMLRVLRERHPEVDIVVLPQTAPAPRAPDLTSAQRGALAGDVERSLDDLLDRLATHPAGGQVRRDATWHSDECDQTWYECAAGAGPRGVRDTLALRRAPGADRAGLGWRARPVPGDRPRLEARRGALVAAATVRPDGLVLTLHTAKVRVADEVAS